MGIGLRRIIYMANFDDLQGAVAQFGAGNKVIFDDTGMPSIMVGIPKMTYSDLITGGTNDTLPFFIVDGTEKNIIWVSKFQNIIENDRAYSLAMKTAKAYITFDDALAACRKKGNGWHLNQNGIFTALTLLSYKMGTVPHGNTNHGRDYYHPYEHGLQTQDMSNQVLTGSGTPKWYHNWDTSGISDLNGNLWEWVAGLRLVDGEIQIIPNGNSMKSTCDMSATSTEWKAILQDGSLVAPGTEGTLKFDRTSTSDATPKISTTVTTQTTDTSDMNCKFKDITALSGVSIPNLLIALGVFPNSGVNYDNVHFWARNNGERLPCMGSSFNDMSDSGVSALDLNLFRHYSGNRFGFRSAYCEL